MKIGIAAVIIGLVLIGIFLVFAFSGAGGGSDVGLDDTGAVLNPTQETDDIIIEDTGDISTDLEHIVEITSSGFSPKMLTINRGDAVVWVNKDTSSHWPASNVHPTHTLYPDSGIQKCGTSLEDSIFDACHGLSQGERYIFTFHEEGTWRYHDHLLSSRTGTIIVE